ncbi:cbb3-type cytochrome c oxidase subunit I [Evansella tamaricis]|uniref:Cbb3-type cytochrome c oxidase subunit I n=1 Tax=Evansella tamaricis TaxID=2069301 RepID=A0ABS6JJG0_9BACI|nr:cbb3-type cytochrome c oxidase subunit I [Evansella tamaricis]
MGVKLIKISVVYFVIGVLLGYHMSMASDYSLTPVHAHVNLLGWTSMTLAGILYVMFPKAEQSLSGKIHFWLHNIGLPLMMLGIFLAISGVVSGIVPLMIIIGSNVVVLAVLVFAFNVFKNVKA